MTKSWNSFFSTTKRNALTPKRPSGASQPATPKRRYRWIAVAASLLCLTVMAAVFVWREVVPSAPLLLLKYRQPLHSPADVHTPASFHFDATPLPEVLAALEQHYGVGLTASDTTHQLTGSFSGQSLEDILSMIEKFGRRHFAGRNRVVPLSSFLAAAGLFSWRPSQKKFHEIFLREASAAKFSREFFTRGLRFV